MSLKEKLVLVSLVVVVASFCFSGQLIDLVTELLSSLSEDSPLYPIAQIFEFISETLGSEVAASSATSQ